MNYSGKDVVPSSHIKIQIQPKSKSVSQFNLKVSFLNKSKALLPRDIHTQSSVPVHFCRYLQQAEQLYSDYSEQVEEAPVDVYALFTPPDTCRPQTKSDNPLERTHTLTLYYLAQVYGTLGNPLKSAIYCHNTLKRQLETTVSLDST